MDKVIQFVANYDDWVAIKKLKIEPNMDPRMIMEFLASLGIGIDAKVEENLAKVVELDKLDSVLDEALEGASGKGEAAIAKAIAAVNSRAVSSTVNEITAKEGFQKNEQKELQQFCKVYATRKAFSALGLPVDYTSVDIPGMKKLKRVKV